MHTSYFTACQNVTILKFKVKNKKAYKTASNCEILEDHGIHRMSLGAWGCTLFLEVRPRKNLLADEEVGKPRLKVNDY